MSPTQLQRVRARVCGFTRAQIEEDIAFWEKKANDPERPIWLRADCRDQAEALRTILGEKKW